MKTKKSFIKIISTFMMLFFAVGLIASIVPHSILPGIAETVHCSVDTLKYYVQFFSFSGGGVIAAAGYYPTNCDTTIPTHACDPCEDREYGRLRSGAFIHKDFAFADGDTTNATEWARGINEGNIIIIPDTNGEMPEPSEKVGPGYGDTTETLLGFDFQAKINDPNFASNCDFYNRIVGNRNFKFAFRTSSKTYITPVPVTIIPKFKVDNDLNSEVIWNVTVKWMSAEFPCPFNTPESVFTCFIPEV